jgi:WXXGXW repeat (2 copies)
MQVTRSIRWLLVALVMVGCLSTAYAGVFVSVGFGPPALPVYTQPLCPGAGYMWTPGYWAYGPEGYYWVPGTWVVAPQPGLLWTPGYWGWGGGAYLWHGGYWGPTIGFYGGINYGFGYVGSGYQGGYWRSGQFYYNQNVNNVNVTSVHNTYNTTVINNTTVNNTSYNGGTGGTTAAATPQELAAAKDPHVVQPTAMQAQHEQAASQNHQLLASVNNGKPAIAATAKPGDFTPHSVVAAKSAGAPYKPPVTNAAVAKPATTVPKPPATNAMTAKPATPPTPYHAPTPYHPASTPATHPAPVTTSHVQPMAKPAAHPAAPPPAAHPPAHSNERRPD